MTGQPQQAVTEALKAHVVRWTRVKAPRGNMLLNLPACAGCDWIGEEFGSDHAAHVAEVVLQAINAAGYTLWRPVTAEEEAANQW